MLCGRENWPLSPEFVNKNRNADIKQTLGAVNHNMSAIPMPTSAMKRSSSVSNLQNPPPQFSTHQRSTSGSRMSLAPSRPNQPVFQRSSSGTNLAEQGLASVKRNSTTNIFGGAMGASTGRKSYAPGVMVAQTPAPAFGSLDLNSQRRSSVFKHRSSSGVGTQPGGGHQSFFTTAPVQAAPPQDPRRLKDASVRSQMAGELMEYLTQHNFEMDMKHSLSHKSMTSPTQKDFNCMFQWLYKRIDPSYRFQKNIDAEVPPLLKQMRYPYEKSIMKSQIAAVGGNNWSTFLGLLHWMMQLSKMMDMYNSGTYDDACLDSGYDVNVDRIVFDFLSDAYRSWLQADDEEAGDDEDGSVAQKLVQPHVEVMAAKFDAANAQHLEQVEMLEAEHKALQDQIDELGKTGPRIAKLDEQIKILEGDQRKFEEYNNSMEAKVEKYQNRAKLLEDEIKKIELELEEAEQEKASLQESVDAQGITVQDIDRMNSERERLQKGVDSTAQRLEESKKRVAEKELEASHKLDELERAVERYNSIGYQISIIPSTAANAKGQDYELRLAINDGPTNFSSSQLGRSSRTPESDRLLADSGVGYQVHNLLQQDVRGTLKNNLLALKKEIGDRRSNTLEADINNHDLLDKIKEAMDDKQAEVEALGHKVRAAEEEFEKTREVNKLTFIKHPRPGAEWELTLGVTDYDGAEDGLGRADRENGEGARQDALHADGKHVPHGAEGNEYQHRVSPPNPLSHPTVLLLPRQPSFTPSNAYSPPRHEQLTLRAAALREELHTEIERMLNDVIKFKVHIQKSLEEYESFVEEEVEREVAADNGGSGDTAEDSQ